MLAGQVLDFDPAEHLPARLLPQTDVSTRFALAGAAWALADAAVDPAEVPGYDMGVITSNATGGFEFTHREFHKLWAKGPEFVSVYESFTWFYAVNTGQISVRHSMRGRGGSRAESYRHVFNHTRPHETLGLRRPAEVHHRDQQPQASIGRPEPPF